MKAAIEKFIENNDKGLFLLDSPTGFGKTYAVKNILNLLYERGNEFV